MKIIYRKAVQEDLERLTQMRVTVLRAANALAEDADMQEVERQSRAYYQEALSKGTHVAYLAYDGEEIVGTGGVSFFRVMPTYHNPTGQKAYVMNMYTAPSHRRQGIARRMLDLLVSEARQRGITAISLEATHAGRPLYESYGFVKMEHEMELP